MLVYILALSLVGWIAAKWIVSWRRRWWMLVVAPVTSFAIVIVVGLSLMILEMSAMGVSNATERFAMALLPALVSCFWSSISNYRR